jgi:tetratricopeptide (TPR) repeat protein
MQAQQNCNIYLWEGDTAMYTACKIGEKTSRSYYQFDQKYQAAYQEAVQICPRYADGYASMSTAYLKSGDFVTWKILIDKAVAHDPKHQLGYRAWCRYQFFRDYKGAIIDIELLDSLITTDLGYGVNGDYHLHFARAFCYAALGQGNRAIEIMEAQLAQPDHFLGNFDYYQLAITYLQEGDTAQATKYLKLQHTKNPIAESAYYQGQIAKKNDDIALFKRFRAEALQLHKAGKRMSEPYTHHMSHVYKQEMED